MIQSTILQFITIMLVELERSFGSTAVAGAVTAASGRVFSRVNATPQDAALRTWASELLGASFPVPRKTAEEILAVATNLAHAIEATPHHGAVVEILRYLEHQALHEVTCQIT